MNEKAKKGLAEYCRKIATGEIEKPKRKTPLEKAEENPNSFKYAILAKCYTCMGEYADGRIDCKITDCPLYKWMPYMRK